MLYQLSYTPNRGRGFTPVRLPPSAERTSPMPHPHRRGKGRDRSACWRAGLTRATVLATSAGSTARAWRNW